ncbi:M20 family peptidase [Roseivirga misakiensis]|uniref:Peptidase M20 dimerisation domain-containing protein n=1 Tax=Roseivirga misakiensis TaxID=1563681 RepID=A0A1E5SKU9_9BACT|nr:M20 family peptidase [Roseivirga misakiensis]OEJ99757.1 hypothetical protein BFP71_09320 [Roseivirga misakiensis]
MKKFALGVLVILVLFVAFLLVKTFTFTSIQAEIAVIDKIPVGDASITRLQEALRLKTISFENEADFDPTPFQDFNDILNRNYPLTDSLLNHQIFSEYSHLYEWKGRNLSLAPIVLMGHIDVVPIASPDKWSVDPFAGEIKDGEIWGRGTIDDKFSVIGILESVEMLLKEGFQPERTIYLAFGHDEEIGGEKGAVVIAKHLENQGVKAAYVLDEGYAITQKLVPGIEADVAMIGIGEKGSTTIEFTVDMDGGHSSKPAKETAIDVLAKAISDLKASPLEASISEAMNGFMDYLGPEMGFVNKLAFANRDLFKGMIISTYENASTAGNALVRTTTAPTVFEAGVKENVIPTYARALVNFRIVPGQTAEDILVHANKVIGDDRVKAKFSGFNSEPSPVSSIETEGFETINKTIKQIFDKTLTGPNLVIAATDSRHFSAVSPNIYRFVPYHINEDNIDTFHGIDERIPIDDYKDAIRFYIQLIKNSNSSQ